MKIHFVGHLLERSGWGRAANDLVKALVDAGASVTCSPVALGKAVQPQENIRPLIGKNIDADYIIQHILPHHMQYSGRYKKNVGYGMFETDGMHTSYMSYYLSLMDEVWSPSNHNESHKTVPYPISQPLDVEPIKIPEIDHTYKFYTVCEYSRRKNIWGMVRSFFRAFIDADNVSLIIKVFSNEESPDNFRKRLYADLETCRINCGLYKVPQVVFITEYLSKHDIAGLHRYADCFVSSSFGESWCYPLVDAISYNKRIISSPTDGATYLKSLGADINLTTSTTDHYHGEIDRLNGYHTLYESCEKPCEIYMADLMRKIMKEKYIVDNSYLVNQLSFENVGRMMCEQLMD